LGLSPHISSRIGERTEASSKEYFIQHLEFTIQLDEFC